MRSWFPPSRRATKRRACAIAAGVVSMAVLCVGAAAEDFAALGCDPEPPAACVAGEPLALDSLSIDGESSAAVSTSAPSAPAGPSDADARSLALAAQSRITRGDADGRLGGAMRISLPRRPTPAPRSSARLEYSGRAWPFALGATADAFTTQWALRRGCTERNPVLAPGGLDVAMVKIVQFPLLALAVDGVERQHPRLGRSLRWATLAFHGALALNNLRAGLAAGRSAATHPTGSAAPR